MSQLQLLILLTLRMEVYPADLTLPLIKTYIVEPLETRSRDRPDPMVRHEEVLLPSHEDVIALRVILEREVGRLGRFGQWPPGGEARPVLEVDFLGGSP